MAIKLVMKSAAAIAFALFLWLGHGVEQALAQNCSYQKWVDNGRAENPDQMSVGGPRTNRRFVGPCGLNVALRGQEAYLENTSPNNESTFNVRFFFYLNNVASDVTIFQAEAGGGSAVITATSKANDSVDVVFAGSPSQTVNVTGVQAGWNSLEIRWSTAAKPKVILGSTSVEAGNLIGDPNLRIAAAKLGAIGTVPNASTASIDFDDYDSRRDTVPAAVCRGLTDPSRAPNATTQVQELKFEDLDNIFAEIASRGSAPAAGSPDFDMDGEVKFSDLDAVFEKIASRQVQCPSANVN